MHPNTLYLGLLFSSSLLYEWTLKLDGVELFVRLIGYCLVYLETAAHRG